MYPTVIIMAWESLGLEGRTTIWDGELHQAHCEGGHPVWSASVVAKCEVDHHCQLIRICTMIGKNYWALSLAGQKNFKLQFIILIWAENV